MQGLTRAASQSAQTVSNSADRQQRALSITRILEVLPTCLRPHRVASGSGRRSGGSWGSSRRGAELLQASSGLRNGFQGALVGVDLELHRAVQSGVEDASLADDADELFVHLGLVLLKGSPLACRGKPASASRRKHEDFV